MTSPPGRLRVVMVAGFVQRKCPQSVPGRSCVVLFTLTPEVIEHHFHDSTAVLVEASSACLDSRGGDMDPTSHWKEYQGILGPCFFFI